MDDDFDVEAMLEAKLEEKARVKIEPKDDDDEKRKSSSSRRERSRSREKDRKRSSRRKSSRSRSRKRSRDRKKDREVAQQSDQGRRSRRDHVIASDRARKIENWERRGRNRARDRKRGRNRKNGKEEKASRRLKESTRATRSKTATLEPSSRCSWARRRKTRTWKSSSALWATCDLWRWSKIDIVADRKRLASRTSNSNTRSRCLSRSGSMANKWTEYRLLCNRAKRKRTDMLKWWNPRNKTFRNLEMDQLNSR